MGEAHQFKSANQEILMQRRVAGALSTVAGGALGNATEPIESKVKSLPEAAGARGDFLDWLRSGRQLEELELDYDRDRRILWLYFNPKGCPSVTPVMAEETRWVQRRVVEHFQSLQPDDRPAVRYKVCGSAQPGIFSMGGDLRLFDKLVRSQDRAGLVDYAVACIDLVYTNYVNLDQPVVTISLVQGDALGGGFEAAVSSNFVIAERSAKFGFPECLFNLFPGMGAYSLLARRISPVEAERMILSGRVYSAEELFELGLVDHLAEEGEGVRAVRDFVDRYDRQHSMRRSVYATRRRVNPLSYDELHDITMMWVDTVLELSEVDLRRMARLAVAQDRRLKSAAKEYAAAR